MPTSVDPDQGQVCAMARRLGDGLIWELSSAFLSSGEFAEALKGTGLAMRAVLQRAVRCSKLVLLIELHTLGSGPTIQCVHK